MVVEIFVRQPLFFFSRAAQKIKLIAGSVYSWLVPELNMYRQLFWIAQHFSIITLNSAITTKTAEMISLR